MAEEKLNFKEIKHIAFIMDGNGRWAKKRLLPRSLGHREGVKRIKETAYLCKEFNIKVMSLYCFSTENWKREKSEIDYLFGLFDEFFEKEIDELIANGCRIKVTGELARLPQSTQEYIKRAIELTKDNDDIILNICLNYGGRNEIVNACKSIVEKVQNHQMSIEDINEDTFKASLMAGDLPDIDVMVRTSGEIRISNYMLYELAYAELIFINTHWPDFKRKEFLEVLKEYTRRDRRFGGVDYGSK